MPNYVIIDHLKYKFALRNITNLVSKDKTGFKCTWTIIFSINWVVPEIRHAHWRHKKCDIQFG